MRIIGGEARGRRLFAPEGLETRPTADNVRESLFNILRFETPGARVLDLFAGSGALALEAISRGAEFAVLADCSRKAMDSIRRNVEACRAQEKTRLLLCDWRRAVEQLTEPFDLVFLDPPYALGAAEVARMVEAGVASGTIAPGALVVYERSAEGEPAPVAGARMVRSRSRGISCVDLMRVGEDHD